MTGVPLYTASMGGNQHSCSQDSVYCSLGTKGLGQAAWPQSVKIKLNYFQVLSFIINALKNPNNPNYSKFACWIQYQFFFHSLQRHFWGSPSEKSERNSGISRSHQMHHRALSFCLPALWMLLWPGRKRMAQGQSRLVRGTIYLIN